jgi:uncharacterized protein (TIRG00374 family)
MRPNSGEDLQHRLVRPLIWSVLIAVGIYAGSVILSDVSAVRESIGRLGIAGWVSVLGLSLLNYGLRFFRWHGYLQRLGLRLSARLSLAYYLVGFAFTTTPGKAGEAIRSLYLKRHGMGYVESLAALFTERFVDLVAMVLLAVIAALAFPGYEWPVLIVTAIVLILLPLIHATGVHTQLERLLQRFTSERIRMLGDHFLQLLRSASSLLKSGPLYTGVLLGLVAWGAEGVALYLILEALGVGSSVVLAVGIYAVSVLGGALSFIPGGLGSTEAIMVLLLKLAGADTASAVAATLICRLATLWFAVAIGGVAIAALELNARATASRATGA